MIVLRMSIDYEVIVAPLMYIGISLDYLFILLLDMKNAIIS